jgi:hypothetical protein
MNVTNLDTWLDAMRGGYTSEQLKEAFELVQPKPHWKAEIQATVPSDTDMKLLDTAIIYYTGAGISYQERRTDGIYVEAPGYWAIIGA